VVKINSVYNEAEMLCNPILILTVDLESNRINKFSDENES